MATNPTGNRSSNGEFVQPLMLPIIEARRVSGLSRSEIYRRLAAGDIRAVKSGSRTLIRMDSLHTYLTPLIQRRSGIRWRVWRKPLICIRNSGVETNPCRIGRRHTRHDRKYPPAILAAIGATQESHRRL